MLDQNQQAVAVLQTAALKAPNDTEILAAYGKALIDVGQLKQAQEVLSRAHSPERPDWRVLSAQGAVSDQLGEHEQAQNLTMRPPSRSSRTTPACSPTWVFPTH